MPPQNNRFQQLDGLRGIAILLVVLFHYLSCLGEDGLYPYGNRFSDFLPFKYGYLGVELFFIISGFVIAMTLETCATPLEFAARRFARLWPPLLIWSVFTFALIRLSTAPFALTSHQELANFLPSLTFTSRDMWTWVSPQVRMVDLVYWSLVVEVRFYIFAAAIFWLLGRSHFGRNLVIFTCVNIILKTLLKSFSPATNELYYEVFIPSFLPWFAAGAVFYEIYKERLSRIVAILLLAPMLVIIARYAFLDEVGATYERTPAVVCVIAVSFFLTFWMITQKSILARPLESRGLVWIGQCSYSLYLIHFEIGMVFISMIPKTIPVGFQLLTVALVIISLTIAARLSFNFFENGGKRVVLRILLNKQAILTRAA
jgi:peptidoglycan/LPS O-acetylase OafA/YrhL